MPVKPIAALKFVKHKVILISGKIFRISFFQKTFGFVYKSTLWIEAGSSLAVTFNSTYPAHIRAVSLGRFTCCTGSLISAHAAKVAKGLNNPVLERQFQLCCIGFAGAYAYLGGPSEIVVGLNYLLNKTTISFNN